MIDIVQQSWAGINYNSFLQHNINMAYEQMGEYRNEIVKRITTTPSLQNTDSLYKWLQEVPTLRGEYILIEFDLNRGQYAAAEARYTTLPTKYHLNAFEQEEYQQYLVLYNFKKAQHIANKDFSDYSNTDIATLEQIASYTSPVFSRAMAREALCFHFNICYPLLRLDAPISNNKPARETLEVVNTNIKAYPNPTQNYITIEFHLAKNEQAHELQILNLEGKVLYQEALIGQDGLKTVDVRAFKKGIYIYKLISNSSSITDKFILN